MPIHSYQCPYCKTIEDKLFKSSEVVLDKITVKKCPKCHKNKVTFKKIISSGSFRLKGDGFYKKNFNF